MKKLNLPLFVMLLTSCVPAGLNQPEVTSTRITKPVEKITFTTDSEKETIAKELGCTDIVETDPELGGLAPRMPMANCRIRSSDIVPGLAENEYIRREGGLLVHYLRYLVKKDGKIQVIKNMDEFKNTFLPINSEEEALSYILALTDTDVRYDVTVPTNYRIFEKDIKDTNVEKTPEGYKVHVFSYQRFGCGPHPHFSETYRLKEDGGFERTEKVKLYENPELDGLCVD